MPVLRLRTALVAVDHLEAQQSRVGRRGGARMRAGGLRQREQGDAAKSQRSRGRHGAGGGRGQGAGQGGHRGSPWGSEPCNAPTRPMGLARAQARIAA